MVFVVIYVDDREEIHSYSMRVNSDVIVNYTVVSNDCNHWKIVLKALANKSATHHVNLAVWVIKDDLTNGIYAHNIFTN